MYYVLCNSDQWAVCWVVPTDQCGPVLPPAPPPHVLRPRPSTGGSSFTSSTTPSLSCQQ